MRANIPDKEQDAYMAGILDGEGCIRIVHDTVNNIDRSYDRYRLFIAVSNTNKNVLEWAADRYGGSVCIHNKFSKVKNEKTCFGWSCQGKHAYNILQKLYPYLIIKRERCQVAFFFMDRDYNDNGESFFMQMKGLNKKGLDTPKIQEEENGE